MRTLAIVGSPLQARRVATQLEGLRLQVVATSCSRLDSLDFDSVLFIADPPDQPLPLALSRVRESHPEVALYVLIDCAPDEVVDLYEAGASTVLSWESDADRLPEVLAQLLGVRRVNGRATEANEKLERAVRAHIKLLDHNYSGLRIAVGDDVVYVRGSVRALWQLDEVREEVEAVPGVGRVSLSAVHVEPPRRSDEAIRKELDVIVEHVTKESDEVSVAVQRGYVALSGRVERKSSRDRLVELIKRVDGVRGLRESLVWQFATV